MGESNSKPLANPDFHHKLANDFRVGCNERDNRLGNVRVHEGQNLTVIAEKITITSDKDEIERYLTQDYAKNITIQCRHIMKIHSYKIQQGDSMCGTACSISTFHEYYQNTLQEELVKRNPINLFYTEAELWAILFSIINASTYLEKNKHSPISDIRPTNIYFTLNGEVKLQPLGVIPYDQTAYQKFIGEGDEALLSPEELQRARQQKLRSGCDQQKCDVYATGQTLLMCASLQTYPSCYNYADKKLNSDSVVQLLNFSKTQYSKFFNNILNILLSENPDDRPTPSTIYAILQPFETEILSLIPFNPDYETVKLALSRQTQQPTLVTEPSLRNSNVRQPQNINVQAQQATYVTPASNNVQPIYQSQAVQQPILIEDQYQRQIQPVQTFDNNVKDSLVVKRVPVQPSRSTSFASSTTPSTTPTLPLQQIAYSPTSSIAPQQPYYQTPQKAMVKQPVYTSQIQPNAQLVQADQLPKYQPLPTYQPPQSPKYVQLQDFVPVQRRI